MLDWLQSNGGFSQRKARLFAVACCRRVWPLLANEKSQKAVEIAERYADGLASEQERADAETAAAQASAGYTGTTWFTALAAKMAVAKRLPLRNVANYTPVVNVVEPQETETRRLEQAQLLHCLIGNPFRPLHAISQTFLAWNDNTVVKITSRAYDERDWSLLPILADTLEDADCEDQSILEPLRGPGPHAKGCWVLDLLLGRA